MGSTTTSFFSVRRRCRGHQPSKGRLGAALIALRRTLARVAATSARLPRSRGRGSPRTRPWRSSTSTSRKGSGRPLLCDRVQTLADLIHVAAEVVEPRQRRERLEAEDPLEQRRDLVADRAAGAVVAAGFRDQAPLDQIGDGRIGRHAARSEEHTSELQSHHDLVCRLLLEKKKKNKKKKKINKKNKKAHK